MGINVSREWVEETALISRKSDIWRSARTLAFPLLTNVWAVLLFVSQKAFVVPGLLLAGAGDAVYRRDILLAIGLTIAGGLVYISQPPNFYQDIHLIGFLLFIWSIPPLNLAVRRDEQRLLRALSYLTLINAGIGYYILTHDVQFYGLRGLNRVETSDGYATRVYFESASFAAVFLIGTFRNRWAQIASTLAIVAFTLFVAKSVVIVALLGLNLAMPYILRSSTPIKVFVGVAAVTCGYALYVYLPILRPDIGLSLSAKQYQLDVIVSLWRGSWLGWGWGSFIPQLSTDVDQPYQIEMQLPMLLLQVGPIYLIAIMTMIAIMFVAAAEKPMMGIGRFLIYALIGFNNPWLFLPSWFLTCQLMFRTEARPRPIAAEESGASPVRNDPPPRGFLPIGRSSALVRPDARR